MLKGLKEVAHAATHNNWHKSRNEKSNFGPGRGYYNTQSGIYGNFSIMITFGDIIHRLKRPFPFDLIITS